MRTRRFVAVFLTVLLLFGCFSINTSAKTRDIWAMLVERGNEGREYLEENYSERFDYFHYELIPIVYGLIFRAIDETEESVFDKGLEDYCWFGEPNSGPYCPISFRLRVTPDVDMSGLELGTISEKLLLDNYGRIVEEPDYIRDIKSAAIYEQAKLNDSTEITDVLIMGTNGVTCSSGIYVLYELDNERVIVASYSTIANNKLMIFEFDDFKKVLVEYENNEDACYKEAAVNSYADLAIEGSIISEYIPLFEKAAGSDPIGEGENSTENEDNEQSKAENSEELVEESEISIDEAAEGGIVYWIVAGIALVFLVAVVALIIAKTKKTKHSQV